MFHCVNCDYEGGTFRGEVAKIDQGVFLYRAKCPNCGSWMVNVLPGIKESDLRISANKDRESCFILIERGQDA